MIIYNYSSTTGEYINSNEAPLNPEATKQAGEPVYMLPAYSTEEKPPKTKKNEVAIYNNGWNISADYRGQYMVNSDMQPVEVTELGDLPEGYIVATKAQAAKIIEDDLYYVIEGNKLIVNPNYEADKQAREDAQFNAAFFNTSLGYVRRKVTMKDGSTKDFLSDILPLLQAGIPVLTYTRQLEQNKVIVTDEFIAECKQQVLVDFYGVE